MKKHFFVAALALSVLTAFGQWAPAGDKIKTQWAEKVDPSNVLPEYPRPLIQRNDWVNLNGLWEYSIRPKGGATPTQFDGNILVPFAIESSLSGVQKEVGVSNELWYKRTFSVPDSWKGKNVILNFGAVDWKCEVSLNGTVIGSHQGGYTPFSFDITPYLVKGEQSLVVRVYDPVDSSYIPRGKQVSKPGGIFYTSVSGIWQTVWMEPVDANHIVSLKTVPNLDASVIEFTASASEDVGVVTVEILEQGKVISSAKGAPGCRISVPVSEPKLWSPDSPYLYDVSVTLSVGGKVVDSFKSYAAMRKVSVKTNSRGYKAIALNDKVIFNYGPLDQGWWPDGLYTAPTDEALAFDVQKTKEFGYNMIRKHVKVEPARWYYHCDRLGVMVWQDMPSGDKGSAWDTRFQAGKDAPRSEESKADYYAEWNEIMDFCYSNPSVIVWIPFNESWGQFDTEKVVEFTKAKDPSRLVNPASGGNFRQCGDILDFHHYPAPMMCNFELQKINVLGEYGGIGLALDGHLWWNDRNFGYVQFKSIAEVTEEYLKYSEILKDLVKCGIAGAVYTQTTDCEGEVNGLMTYDRKVMKMDVEKVSKANNSVIRLGE